MVKDNKFDIELSKKIQLLQLRFLKPNRDIFKSETISFEIKKLTSSNLEFSEQLLEKNQRYQVKIVIGNNQNNRIINETSKLLPLEVKEYQLKGIEIPSLSEYEIDLDKVQNLNVITKSNKVIMLKDQFLWLADTFNPNPDAKLTNTIPKYITGNSIIDIQMKSRVNVNKNIIEQKPLRQIAKYANKLNLNNLFSVVDTFNEFENNLFYLCIAQLQDADKEDILTFSSKQIKELVSYKKNIGNAAFLDKIRTAFDKFLDIKEIAQYKDTKTGENVESRRHFFRRCDVYMDSLKVQIQIDQGFFDLFHDMPEWTRFSLLEYVKIKSNYSKKLYRLLKGG